jgi:hypothetical protein
MTKSHDLAKEEHNRRWAETELAADRVFLIAQAVTVLEGKLIAVLQQ